MKTTTNPPAPVPPRDGRRQKWKPEVPRRQRPEYRAVITVLELRRQCGNSLVPYAIRTEQCSANTWNEVYLWAADRCAVLVNHYDGLHQINAAILTRGKPPQVIWCDRSPGQCRRVTSTLSSPDPDAPIPPQQVQVDQLFGGKHAL